VEVSKANTRFIFDTADEKNTRCAKHEIRQKKLSKDLSHLTVQEGVVGGGRNPLLVPILAQQPDVRVLGLIFGKVQTKVFENGRGGWNGGRSLRNGTRGAEGGGRGQRG